MNRIVVAAKNGYGEFVFPTPKNGESLVGKSFFIEGLELKIGSRNRVSIPPKLMEKYGHLRGDGRYAISIAPSWTHIDGVLQHGGSILKDPGIGKYLEVGKNGESVPEKLLNPEEFEYLKPYEGPDWYPARGGEE